MRVVMCVVCGVDGVRGVCCMTYAVRYVSGGVESDMYIVYYTWDSVWYVMRVV